jgi:hypothetical protein
MVTHNASARQNGCRPNNRCASGAHLWGELPPAYKVHIRGLETAHIGGAVCDILEGGERAFQERARRLRVLGMRRCSLKPLSSEEPPEIARVKSASIRPIPDRA